MKSNIELQRISADSQLEKKRSYLIGLSNNAIFNYSEMHVNSNYYSHFSNPIILAYYFFQAQL